MRVNSIQLSNYRNYSSFQTDFSPGLNIIVGDNAQGKTNLLEAIYFMSTLRSFRTQSDRDLILSDNDYFRIQCEIEDSLSTKKLQVLVFKNGKSIKINETIVKRSSDYLGTLNCVIFSPNDLNFFNDTPRTRRRFLDIEATKISSEVLHHLNQYFDVLKQRNALLKNEKVDDALLDILTKQLIDHMWVIVDYRLKMVSALNKAIQPLFDELSKGKHQIELIYQTEIMTKDKQQFKELMSKRMEQNRMRDKYFKVTHSGPHRDDLTATIDSHDITQMASQGQKRLILIALKMALIQFIKEETQTTPILLLDDVFSELDEDHQQRFLQNCPTDSQIFLTTTSIDSLKLGERPVHLYEIGEGQLISRRDNNG